LASPFVALGKRKVDAKAKISGRGLSIRAIPFVVVLSGASGADERKEHTMSVSTVPTSPGAIRASAHRTRAWSLRRTTVVVGLIAAAVVTAVAALVHAAGVSLEIDGEMIPLLGFAQLTFLGAVVGGFLLAGLNRWSAAPRHRFVQTAVALTALSCVPSVTMPSDIATKVALTALHVLAAAIIVPVLLKHAND
jgi:hypothetical protein